MTSSDTGGFESLEGLVDVSWVVGFALSGGGFTTGGTAAGPVSRSLSATTAGARSL